jgi:hypothetical protein
MEEHELREISTRAAKAEKLLQDETFSGAFNSVRAAIFERWESCSIEDKESAHELKVMLKLLNDLRGNIEMAVHNGRMAANELNIDKNLLRKIKDRTRIF